MFDSDILSYDDSLKKYVKERFRGILEFELELILGDDEIDNSDLEMYFTKPFVRKYPERAKEILLDLIDISESNIVRETLNPIHNFAMYNILRSYAACMIDFAKDGATPYIPDGLIEQIDGLTCDPDDKEDIMRWFTDAEEVLEDFVDTYDDEFIWDDIWERYLKWEVDHPDENGILTPEAEEMFLLMPTDLLEQYKKNETRGKMMKAIADVNKTYDIFISHASEDKDEVARPLAKKLEERGLTVFFDEISIGWGDSLRKKIDEGIRNSRMAIVIISRAFRLKKWTNEELDGFFTVEDANENKILPLWHDISAEEVKEFSPLVASRKALTTADYSLDEIADMVVGKLA